MMPNLKRVLRYSLAAAWGAVGVAKILSPAPIQVGPWEVSPAVAPAAGVCEVLMGVALAVAWRPRPVAFCGVALLFLASLAAVLWPVVDCGCLGGIVDWDARSRILTLGGAMLAHSAYLKAVWESDVSTL